MGKIRGGKSTGIARWFFSCCYSYMESLVCEMQLFLVLLKLVHWEYLLCVFGVFCCIVEPFLDVESCFYRLQLMWPAVRLTVWLWKFTISCILIVSPKTWFIQCRYNVIYYSLSSPKSYAADGICWCFYLIGKKYPGKQFTFLIFTSTNRVLGHVWYKQTCVSSIS